MKTYEGYELKEGDRCRVSCQYPQGMGYMSPMPREAVYQDDVAKANGWNFHILNLPPVDVDIRGVWRHYPEC